ncbi:MAG: DUF3291 domain-containing protein [Bacteroidetes bacterium]|nr:DUF3291 domain-containing protein [Fibrella sp.]
MTTHHLAQINVSRLLAPLDSPQLADFVANLEPINALADHSPGFVWRLKSTGGNATDIQIFDDPMIIVNMSVWTDIDALKNFAFTSAHAPVMKRRREWFETFPTAYMALWWIDAGHIPTLAEARHRLEHLDQHGPTAVAFTFKRLFDQPAAGSADHP